VTALAERYEARIGLEVHVQLATRSKIFCACSAAYGSPPNTHVCPVCLGHPGTLPVLNRDVVLFALRFGRAVGAAAGTSVFARKNYFYPDLPKGYQISQYDRPILTGGAVRFRVDGEDRSLRLTRAHLEEDAGKSFHPEHAGERMSRVDLNRAGVPLLEVVSEPDLTTPAEAHAVMERIRQIVLYLGICDGNMEEGSLRCDANVSVRVRGQAALNPKTEIKNLNSFRHVERALTYEITRQARALEDGEPLIQATRAWDDGEGRTRLLRTKEEAEDYRYFAEPDLPPVVVNDALAAEAGAGFPELPWDKENRLTEDLGLSRDDAERLAADPELSAWFEEAAAAAGNARGTANWVLTEVFRVLKHDPRGVGGLRVSAGALGRLVKLVDSGEVTGRIAKTVFQAMVESGGEPEAVLEARGLTRITDPAALGGHARRAVDANPGPLAEYLAGKETAQQFFMGQIMRATGGRADPQAAARAVRDELESRRGKP